MKFPKRADQHIKDTNGYRLFLIKSPPQWIIREHTERDYGIDAYLEIIENKYEVSGNLCLIQLKTSQAIKWSKNLTTCKSIKKSTISYWMNLPVPVFLIWADINSEAVYFTSVKDYVRSHYDEYQNDKKTMSFEFIKIFELGTTIGNQFFVASYYRERNFPLFISYLKESLIHARDYYLHIVGNKGRDPFLGVEDDDMLKTIQIYTVSKILAHHFSIEWKVQSLKEIIKADQKQREDPVYILHELSHGKILHDIEQVFLKILITARKVITQDQKSFWERNEFILYETCMNMNIDAIKEI